MWGFGGSGSGVLGGFGGLGFGGLDVWGFGVCRFGVWFRLGLGFWGFWGSGFGRRSVWGSRFDLHSVYEVGFILPLW